MKGEIRIRVNKKHARIKQFFKPVIRKNQTNDLIEKILRFVINYFFFFHPLQERFLTTQNPFQFVPGYRGSSQFPILLPPNRGNDFLPRSQKTTPLWPFHHPLLLSNRDEGREQSSSRWSEFVCLPRQFPKLALSLHYRSYNRDSTCNRTYDCWSIGVHSKRKRSAAWGGRWLLARYCKTARPMIPCFG